MPALAHTRPPGRALRVWLTRSHLGLCALVAACGATAARPAPPRTVAARCYDLPGASRYSLRLRGQTAYWIERSVDYDYVGDSGLATRLVAFDRASGRATTIATGIDAPFRLLDDGGVLFRRDGAVVLWRAAGGGRVVTPRGLSVSHFELAPDQRSIVALASDATNQGLVALRLDGVGGPRWLGAFDALYAVTAEGALALRGDALMRAPQDGGPPLTITELPATHVADVINGWIVHYDEERFLARPLATPDATHDITVVGAPGGWLYTLAPDHVFVKRPDGDRMRAARIEGGALRPLPSILGGAAIIGAEPIPGGVLALVAHDTDHSGAADDDRDEVDVCTLAANGDLTLPTRHLPRRLAGAEAQLAAIAAGAGATWRVFEDAPGPLTVELAHTTAIGADLAAARAAVRAHAAALTQALGDDEVRIMETWSDGRTATSYTDGETHRRVTTAGIGRATLADPGEHDLDVLSATATRADGLVTCEGTVVNRGHAPLAGAVAMCLDQPSAQPIAIAPDPLPPGATGHFAGRLTDVADADATVWFAARGAPLLVVREDEQAHHRALYDAAVIARDRSRLTLWTWTRDGDGEDDKVVVDVDAPGGFADFSASAQEVAATAAWNELAAVARSATDAGPEVPVILRIALGGDSVIDYDGTTLGSPHDR
ncbi:MAG: hypothetical protein K8W52_25850 [Deltaproteobacteria bacterium]|nr:hypothetical protein [Deltaproteobacteria bacterium]